MLKHTFIHVPGVGPRTELKLWDRGILSWEHYLANSGQSGLGRRSQLNLDKYIESSVEALRHGNALFFEYLLPKREIWRIYREFEDRSVFLDIEGQERIRLCRYCYESITRKHKWKQVGRFFLSVFVEGESNG